MIKAILFDLDGTLVNTIEDLASSVNYVLKNNGFPVHSLGKYNYFVGSGIPNLIERALPENERTEENVCRYTAEFLAYYSKHFADKSAAYPGIYQLIRGLKRNNIHIAVVTNKAQEMTDLVIKKVFGEGVFDSVVGKREENPVKPDPKSAFIAVNEMNVNPDECIFAGDSGVDMLTAANCGALPVGVLWGFRTEDELKKAGAKFLIKNPGTLLNIIGEINK